ncbi:MAG: LamG domain-containing protein, partial [Planctomycetes bacterium]|nr:LamG domain-containing protein [Planctomycetota bacterium]
RRDADFALADFAPEGDPNGDCVIDYKELDVMSRDWLASDRVGPPLMAWYKFDGDANDSSGKGNHGTLNGDPLWVAGHVGSGALEFDGVGDEMSVPYSDFLNPQERFTASLWANVAFGSTGYRAALSCRNDYPQRGYIIYATPGDVWEFWTGTGTGWHGITGPSVNAGQWVHLAAVFVNGTKRLYVDRALVGEATGTSFMVNDAEELLVGAGANETPAHNYFFVGLIDDVRIYDKGLSQTEIASIMDGTLGSVSDYRPVLSPAELYAGEVEGSRKVNFKDYAELMNVWLDEDMFP